MARKRKLVVPPGSPSNEQMRPPLGPVRRRTLETAPPVPAPADDPDLVLPTPDPPAGQTSTTVPTERWSQRPVADSADYLDDDRMPVYLPGHDEAAAS